MKMSTAVFYTTFSLAVLVMIMSCSQINPRPAASMRDDYALNDDVDKSDKCIVAAESGSGLFRDPLELFGVNFLAAHVCELRAVMRAGYVAEVKFTRLGKKTCSKTCALQYERITKMDGAAAVSAVSHYCDYTGVTDRPASVADLSSTCVCLYKATCNGHNRIVAYSFELNEADRLRVSVSEADGLKKYVT